jgi:hypothetical protein
MGTYTVSIVIVILIMFGRIQIFYIKYILLMIALNIKYQTVRSVHKEVRPTSNISRVMS